MSDLGGSTAAFMPPDSPLSSPQGSPVRPSNARKTPNPVRKVSTGHGVMPLSTLSERQQTRATTATTSNDNINANTSSGGVSNITTTSRNNNGSNSNNKPTPTSKRVELPLPLVNSSIVEEEFLDSDEGSMSPGTPTNGKHFMNNSGSSGGSFGGIINGQEDFGNFNALGGPTSPSNNTLTDTTTTTTITSHVDDLLAQTDSLLHDTGDMLSSRNIETVQKYSPCDELNQLNQSSFDTSPFDSLSGSSSPGLLGENDTQPGMSESMFFPSAIPPPPPPSLSKTNNNNPLDSLGEDKDEDEDEESDDILGAMTNHANSTNSNGNSSSLSSLSSSSSTSHPLGISVVMTNATISEADPASDISIVRGDASQFFGSTSFPSSSTSTTSSSSSQEGSTSVTMKIRLRQDVPGNIVNDVLTTILLSKGMVVVLKEADTMRAESKSSGRTVTIVLGVVRESKHRVACISMHGCAAPYVDLSSSHSNNGGVRSRGSSFTEIMSSATDAVSDLLMLNGSTSDGNDNRSASGNGKNGSTSNDNNGGIIERKNRDVFAGIGLDVFTQTLFESLRISFQHQGLTLSSMMQLRPYFDFDSNINENTNNKSNDNSRDDNNSSEEQIHFQMCTDDKKDSLIAPDYLKQLRSAYRSDMIYELTAYAEPLDK